MAEIFNFNVQDNRSIQFPKSNLLEPIMQEDHNVAVWRFRIPKVLNDIDMSGWAWWFVYVNAKNEIYSESLTLVDDVDEPDTYCTADYSIDYGISKFPGSFSFSLEAISAEQGGEIDGEWHTKTYTHKVDKTLQGNQAQFAETESDIISALITEFQIKIRQLVGGATPEPKNLIADMTDTSKVYLYVGSEEDESNGYWYYHNGTRFVPGGVYASGITVDAVPTQESNNAVRSGGVYSALADKVSKPLTSPNGTNGQLLRTLGNGQTEWTDFATPTDAQVGEAVSDWLDNHPEATTTVQDGSLTQAKFSADLQLAAIKDYVIPEMFGAIGDGVSDDTQAIHTALATGKDVLFSNKTYATSGITISQKINVLFNNATFIAITDYQDYVINVTSQVVFKGNLYIDGKQKALNGIKFTNANGSIIDYIKVSYCLAWGVNLKSCNHMQVGFISASYCGKKISATVSYYSDYVLTIDNTLTAQYSELLSSEYAVNLFIYDTSGYTPSSAVAFAGVMVRKAASFDVENTRLTMQSTSANKIPTNYTDKACVICFGGALLIGDQCYSQNIFSKIDTRNGATGVTFTSTYGHFISSMYSQSDAIPVAITSYSQGNFFGSFSSEGSQSGYSFVAYNYDYSVLVTKSTDYKNNLKASDVANIILGSEQGQNIAHVKSIIRRVSPQYYNSGDVYIVTEQSPDVLILRNKNQFKINLVDTFQNQKSYNPFGVKTVYILPSTTQSNQMIVSLHNNLISAGYTIDGGTDGVLTFDRPSLWFKLQIVLFDKTFTVLSESLTKVTNA